LRVPGHQLGPPAADRFYALYREQYNPDLTVPDTVVEEYRGLGKNVVLVEGASGSARDIPKYAA